MSRRFSGEYADDGPARRYAVREAAGHRCIRCQHPYQSGQHGKGEWSPCDERCTHKGPIREILRPSGNPLEIVSNATAGRLVKECRKTIEAKWRILTVHHFDGSKDNDAWWNTMALCQRCHLEVQTKVDPLIPFFFEHSPWAKPYVAGFYAKRYLGLDLTRQETEARLEELLALELHGGKR